MATEIAIYAAVIATVTALWNIYLGFRDRLGIKLLVERGTIFQGQADGVNANLGVKGPYLFARALSTGRRPVTIMSGGLQEAGGKKVVMEGQDLPTELREGQQVTLWIHEDRLAKLSKVPTHIWFLTGTDHYRREKIPDELKTWIHALGGSNREAGVTQQ